MGQRVPPQQRREHADPTERSGAVPNLMLVLVVAMVLGCVAYLFTEQMNQPSSWGDGRDAQELAGAASQTAGSINAAALYASMCSACHQSSGQGLPGVFPPLAGSEWVVGKPGTAAAIVLYGVSGPLKVGDKAFNGSMPSFKDQLSDDQIAALLSHLRSQWGNSASAVSPSEVAAAREQFKSRTGAFAGDAELPEH